MRFSDALAALVDHKVPIQRECWPENHMVLHTGDQESLGLVKSYGVSQREWYANSDEMLADDWRIVESDKLPESLPQREVHEERAVSTVRLCDLSEFYGKQ